MKRTKLQPGYLFIGWLAALLFISLACGMIKTDTPEPAVEIPDSQEAVINPGPYPDPDPDPAAPVPAVSQEGSHPLEPALNAEPLTMLAKGFGQKEQELGVGFITDNPNQDIAYQDSQYQIAVYNAEGTVVKTDGGYIDLIMPAQKLGIGRSIYLDEGTVAARIEVQLNSGEPVQTDQSGAFTSEKVTYQANEYSSSVIGVITNPYPQDITYLGISAILYDGAGAIIGGGNTYLSFLLANASVGVLIPVASAGEVSRVELYPVLSALDELASKEQLPAGASDVVVSTQGYGQNKTSVGAALILTNPNQGYAIEGTMYHMTAYSDSDQVLAVYDGYIDLLLPDQTLGIANSLYVGEGAVISRIDTQLKTGNFTVSEAIAPLTSENVNFLPDDYSPEVTGEIVSPYSKDISNVQVIGIAYNDKGDIIGSGSSYLDFIPANGKSAVSVYMTVAGTPAKVELYAMTTSLSELK